MAQKFGVLLGLGYFGIGPLTLWADPSPSLSLSSLLSPLSGATPPLLTPRCPPPPVPRRRSPDKPLRLSTAATRAAISVGDRLPDATLSYFDPAGKLQTTTVSSPHRQEEVDPLRRPGAFTPICSQKHLPGFVKKVGELKAKGVGNIACISVNDAFVMRAWKENLGIGNGVMLLSDGNRDFTMAIGCELDLSNQPVGLGVWSRRYALLVEDSVVKVLNLEEGGALNGAEDMLKVL